MSPWSDQELDKAVSQLRVHYPKAGQSVLYGMLQRLDHHILKCWIGESLLHIDLVCRIHIQRQKYWVLGSNALWPHNGQHSTSINSQIDNVAYLIPL